MHVDILLKDIFNYKAKYAPSLLDHMNILYEYAQKCEHITEIGTGCIAHGETGHSEINSLYAWLYAGVKTIRTYDIFYHRDIEVALGIAKALKIDLKFILFDKNKHVINGVSIAPVSEQTDLLFIDSLHTFKQLTTELDIFHKFVKRYIILHDTEAYGVAESWGTQSLNDPNEAGLRPAVANFIDKNPDWIILRHCPEYSGLTILERLQNV